MRPTWDETWMNIAHNVALRSRCARSQAGCVVVTTVNHVAAVGYNGPPAGWKSTRSSIIHTTKCDAWCPRAQTGGSAAYYDDCVSSHAEMNALVRGDRRDYEGGTLYVTRTPCFTCAKVIANSGVSRVVHHIAPEDKDREPERSIAMLMLSGIAVRELPYA